MVTTILRAAANGTASSKPMSPNNAAPDRNAKSDDDRMQPHRVPEHQRSDDLIDRKSETDREDGEAKHSENRGLLNCGQADERQGYAWPDHGNQLQNANRNRQHGGVRDVEDEGECNPGRSRRV